ncbi:hypothetical protein C8R43DRAFT_1039927 [Mycena crocata]|nr:hypothetical protein C8R43DRAFT_1039927 [Mycena crocata]
MNLSQVCLHWHDIVLGTPALWDNVDLGPSLWKKPAAVDTVVKQLQLVLQRGANHPLFVQLRNVISEPVPSAVLHLLAQHASRWNTVTLFCPIEVVEALGAIRGNLPNLEDLMIHLWGETPPSALDIFKAVPQLTKLFFSASADQMEAYSSLPFEQITDVQCVEDLWMDSPTTTTFMPRLSQTAALHLHLSLLYPDLGLDASFVAPPVTSDIATLRVGVTHGYLAAHVEQALDAVLTSFTLPYLRKLLFTRSDYPRSLFPWRHAQFLTLARRSSFQTHLHTLDLYHVVITEEHLLESLDALPSLEQLSISDQLVPGVGMYHTLITDTLLAALADSALIPRLHSFFSQSLLKFDDNAYWNFVLSRVRELPTEVPFRCALSWFVGHSRPLDLAVSAQLRELCVQKGLSFSFAPSEYEA